LNEIWREKKTLLAQLVFFSRQISFKFFIRC
jgi:hypothetical protein